MGFGSMLASIAEIMSEDFNLPFGIGSRKTQKYPSDVNTVSIERYTNIAGTGTEWKDSLGYSFEVRAIANGFSFPASGWKEFRLQINPQELVQDEIFAIEVTPTLRGVLVEHHGSTIKDITISGTTGVSPRRREAGTNRDGAPIFATGHSGYKEFHDLRSYFRVYVEAKRTDSEGNLRLVFRNYRDKEYLYVEPIKFTMKRSAKRPMLYDYTIVLKAIGVADKPWLSTDWLSLMDIANMIDSAIELLDSAGRVINGAFGIINRFQRDLNSTLMAPVQALAGALQAIRGGSEMTLTQMGITRKAVKDLGRIGRDIQVKFAEGIGRNVKAYNAASGRTSTLVGNPNRQTTYAELSILNALSKIQKALLIVSGLDLFESNVFKLNATVAEIYGASVKIKEPSGVASVDILATDDLQTIASREFGDPDKFRDIAILNNLKAPYISATPGPGVLSPGMKILVPKYSGSGSTGVARNKEYNITKGLEESEKSLGVDIRITGDGDLAISNTKDLDLLAGMKNMGQACALKMGYSSGSLKRHPGIGTDLQIGGRAATSANVIRDQIVSSFISDNRVESIPFIELQKDGGAIEVNMLLKLKGADQPIPIPIKLNLD